jgi:DNA invertase Pin-like site-specific DNA recombinase
VPALKVVGYVRVSTEEQGLSGASLAAQRRAIRAECGRRGWELISVEQDVQSAKSMNRPGLRAALALCTNGDVDGIVVAKLDRLSRSVVDFASVLETARRRGFNVSVIDLGLDLSTPQGELVGNVIASVAQWERRIIGERTREALAAKRSDGVRLGRPPTLPSQVVQRIVCARKAGKSLRRIADELNEAHVPTAQGGDRWYAATVRYTLMRSERARSGGGGAKTVPPSRSRAPRRNAVTDQV